jgi:polysaccharide pyruvyl transferase WcaK-like protein
MTAPREWPPGRPRVLATDAWLANAGDAAIALALDGIIRELAPAASILHSSYQHDLIGPRLAGLTCVPPLDALLGTRWAPPAPGWEDAGAQLVEGADLVICQGGGFLVEAYEPRTRLASLADVVRRGKPLVLAGVTIDHFRSAPLRADLHTVLAGAALTVVRDPMSLAHAGDCGAVDVVLGTDLALAFFTEPPPDRERHDIGVVLTDHHPDAARRPQLADLASVVLREAVDAAAGQPVTVWSTVQGEPDVAREDDSRIAADAIAALSESSRATVRMEPGYIDPARAIEASATCRALITMRMHPALFAAGSGTPFALMLGGQRTGVFAGSTLAARVVAPSDREGISAAISATCGEAAPVPTWEALAPLRARLDDTRSRLAELLDRVEAGIEAG